MSFPGILRVKHRLRNVYAIADLGAFMMLVYASVSFDSEPFFGIGLVAIFILGGVVGYVVVRCPSCDLNLTRYVVNNVPRRDTITRLETFEQCPRCHFRPTETKATVDVILSSFSTLMVSLWRPIETTLILILLILCLPFHALLRSRGMQYLYRQRHGYWLVPVWTIAVVGMFAPFFVETWFMKMWAGPKGERVLAAYFVAIPVSAMLLTLWWQRSPYRQPATAPPRHY